MAQLLNQNSNNDLQEYLTEHITMQLQCFNLSAEANRLGYPGFAHYFKVQAQDEILHQRWIINFIADCDGTYCVDNIKVNNDNKKCDSLLMLMEHYQKHRQHFSNLTTKLANNAKAQNDLVTYKFYDWFIIDFYEELAEIKDIIDWIKMANHNYYDLDSKLGTREEPDTLLVIDPFSYHS
ncbi:ferritin-like domain-containing protein [Spiroplasma poulsonii]|uniref:Ferritin n=2 Tax=Spiroplasmataceae TaxID=2131 RepID=A0A2P6FE54_9MOLU|nr:ferritin-like domain-containing protein [Spiroplasma poulsonii]KAF0850731.1 Ferritin [Spiroplasma poulsonii]PQM31741.1 Ferritin [Spiroplasma poulsonii]PWF96773.1 Ferritin [Spiroplasma poulsonii]PWF97347.1 Ferritin [Spiroplasma poulsonii]